MADFQREKDENAIFYKEKSLDEVLKDEQDKDKYKKEVAEILSLNKDKFIFKPDIFSNLFSDIIVFTLSFKCSFEFVFLIPL